MDKQKLIQFVKEYEQFYEALRGEARELSVKIYNEFGKKKQIAKYVKYKGYPIPETEDCDYAIDTDTISQGCVTLWYSEPSRCGGGPNDNIYIQIPLDAFDDWDAWVKAQYVIIREKKRQDVEAKKLAKRAVATQQKEKKKIQEKKDRALLVELIRKYPEELWTYADQD